MTDPIVAAFLDSLDDDALNRFAERLRPMLATESHTQPQWLTVIEAAEYLRCPKSRLYALVSARRIPFCKDGSRTLFNRDELDAWVRAGGAIRP